MTGKSQTPPTPTPIELLIARGVAALGEIAENTRPDEPPRIGNVSMPTQTDAHHVVRHVPVLQMAFNTKVPASYLELAPELARVNCPCGMVVEVEPNEIRECHGPEDGECPRFYLYTGESVRVANTDTLPELPLKGPA